MPLHGAHAWVLEVDESRHAPGLFGIDGLCDGWAAQVQARAAFCEGLYRDHILKSQCPSICTM